MLKPFHIVPKYLIEALKMKCESIFQVLSNHVTSVVAMSIIFGHAPKFCPPNMVFLTSKSCEGDSKAQGAACSL